MSETPNRRAVLMGLLWILSLGASVIACQPSGAPRPAKVWIDSMVHGAEVRVDGQLVGETSRLAAQMFLIDPNSRTLTISRECYREGEYLLELRPGQSEVLHAGAYRQGPDFVFEMQPSLDANATSRRSPPLAYIDPILPAGFSAEVWSGEYPLLSLVPQLPVDPGERELELRVPGYEPLSLSHFFEVGEVYVWRIDELSPLPAELRLRCDVAGATIEVDGVEVARTIGAEAPTLIQLPISAERLVVSSDDAGRQEFSLSLLPGESVELDCELGAEDTQIIGTSLSGFTLIDAGTFVMGSPAGELGRFHASSHNENQRQTTLTRNFYIQTTPVTQGEYRTLTNRSPAHFSECGDDCPVEMVSWWDALDYANAMSRRAGLRQCYELIGCTYVADGSLGCDEVQVNAPGGDPYQCEGYRLPTEAEWEYAARAGTTTGTYADELTSEECDDQTTTSIGWSRCNSDETTHPVAQKLPNAWGLYDTLGNVYEWTWDWYDGSYGLEDTDPLGPERGSYRVMRGGSWSVGPAYLRAAHYFGDSPDAQDNRIGFRVVRTAR